MANNFDIDDFFIKYSWNDDMSFLSLQYNSEKMKFPLVGDYVT